WNDLRYFLALYRARTFAAAARLLDVDATTMGRRLASLEQRLGTRLFDRTPDGLAPTEEALRVLPTAQGVEEKLLAFERAASRGEGGRGGGVGAPPGEPRGPLSWAGPPPGSCPPPPDVEIDLPPDPRPYAPPRREADVAIRLYRPDGDSLIARRLGTLD